MRLKRFLSTMLAAAMLFNTVSEPLIATASNTEESKFHEIVDTGTFDECTDALLEDFLSYGKVPEEKRKAYLESLTSEERYEFQIYAKYAYMDLFKELGEKPTKDKVEEAAKAVDSYVEILSKEGTKTEQSDKRILKKLEKRHKKDFQDYSSLNAFLSQSYLINFRDLLIELESIPSVDTEIFSKNVIKFKEYVRAVYGFSDTKTYNGKRIQYLNNFYEIFKEMSSKEKTDFFDSLTEEERYEINLIAKYYLLLQIVERSTLEHINATKLVPLMENVKPAVEVAMKTSDANPQNKTAIREATCRHISYHQGQETTSFNTLHKNLQKETDLKITSILKELDALSKAEKVSTKVSAFQSYLYQLFGVKEEKGKDRAVARSLTLNEVISGNTDTYIPGKYAFNPKYGGTKGQYTANFKYDSAYKWQNYGSSIKVLRTSGKDWFKPSSTTDGKFYVRYNNVGNFEGQKVDMKVTYSKFGGSCIGIGYGKQEIAQGYANLSNDYNSNRYIEITIEFFKAGTNTLMDDGTVDPRTGEKCFHGYMTLNDLDYFKDSTPFAESFEAVSGITTQLYANTNNYKKISVSGDVISAATGIGGTGATDGGNVVYCFFKPKHVFRWKGALNNYSVYDQNVQPEQVLRENRIRHWLNGFTTGGTNASKKNFLFDETFFDAAVGKKFTMDKSRKSSKMPNGFQLSYFRQYNGSSWTKKDFPQTITQENNKMYFEYRYDPISSPNAQSEKYVHRQSGVCYNNLN